MTFISFNLVLLFRCPLIAPNLHFKMHEVRDASPIARQVTVSKYRQTQPSELVISLSTCSAIMYPNNRSAWKSWKCLEYWKDTYLVSPDVERFKQAKIFRCQDSLGKMVTSNASVSSRVQIPVISGNCPHHSQFHRHWHCFGHVSSQNSHEVWENASCVQTLGMARNGKMQPMWNAFKSVRI